MTRYMLDTDICSYAMKRSSAEVVKRLRSLPVEDVCMSVVSKAELLYGARVSPRRTRDTRALDAFLRHVQVVELDEAVADHYGDIRADLKARGAMIGANALLIAAHARSFGLTLVTNNTRELGRVPELQIESWREE